MSNHAICVIDDNDTFRESTRWLLSGMGHQVSDFADPTTGLDAINSGIDCDCLLMDVRMPHLSGLDVHEKLLESGSQVPVIYMTGHGDVALAVEAMNKGAITFLEKPLDTQALGNAIDTAAQIQAKRKNNGITQQKLKEFANEMQTLTPREREVMQAIVDGKANKVIAFDLEISQKTVELHRSRVMKKLPVKSAQELVKMVVLSR